MDLWSHGLVSQHLGVEPLKLQQRETNQPSQDQQRNILDADRGSVCDGSLLGLKQEASADLRLHRLHLVELVRSTLGDMAYCCSVQIFKRISQWMRQ